MRLTKRQRTWTHKSVRALIQEEGGGDPIEIVRAKAKGIVRWAKELGWKGPPYNPRELASMRGIRSRESATLFSAEAQLTPMDGDQLLLEFNPNRCTGRQNYSISHELVHTFFDDCFEMIHQRNSNRASFDPKEEVELLCQIGAAELLMPEEDFRADLDAVPFSLESIPPLCWNYDASREAVARRMLALGGRTAALIFLSKRLKPVEIRALGQPGVVIPEPKMRVLYSTYTEDFPFFLPEHKSAPDSSCVYNLQTPDEVVSAVEIWSLSGYGDCIVEAMALPVPNPLDTTTPTVMALIQPVA